MRMANGEWHITCRAIRCAEPLRVESIFVLSGQPQDSLFPRVFQWFRDRDVFLVFPDTGRGMQNIVGPKPFYIFPNNHVTTSGRVWGGLCAERGNTTETMFSHGSLSSHHDFCVFLWTLLRKTVSTGTSRNAEIVWFIRVIALFPITM